MSTNQTSRTESARRAAATRAANKRYAASLASLDAAIIAAQAASDAIEAAYELTLANMGENAVSGMADMVHNAMDAVAELAAQRWQMAHDHEFSGIDSVTRSLVAQNID